MNKLVFFLPVIMTVIANTLYHISARGVSSKVDPFFSLIISYGVALLGSLVLFLVTKHQPISANWHALTWPSVTLGAAIIFIEFGYMVDCKFNPNALPNYERLSFLLDLLDLAKLSGPTQ